MQRILRRAGAAAKHAEKRKAKKRREDRNVEMDMQNQEATTYKKISHRMKSIPLKELKEDWKRGPLAQRREGGIEAQRFGLADYRLSQPPKAHILKQIQRERECDYGHLRNRFANGDRVVIVKGPHTGTISTIEQIDNRNLTADLRDIDISFLPPDSALRGVSDTRELGSIQTKPMPYLFENLRLVTRVGNRDVIVDKVKVLGSTFNDKEKSEDGMIRLVPTTDTLIGKPDILFEDNDKKDDEDDDISKGTPRLLDSDSSRAITESITFKPTLSLPPFPGSILDELRNKHSDFRTRFSDKFVKQQLKRDEKEEIIKETVKLMTTPTKEIYAKQAKEQYDLSHSRTLSQDSLALLDNYMQKNKVDSRRSSQSL